MQKEIQFNNSTIKYYRHGQGDTCLFFIHGFAEDHTVWDNQLNHFKNDHNIILVDLPGCGASEALHEEISMKLLADLINDIVEKENVKKFVILGHSMGGYIALQYLSIYPEKVSALGLLHSSAYADDAEKLEKRKQAITVIEKKGKDTYLNTTYRSLLHGEDHINKYLSLLEKMGEKIKAKVLVAYIKAMMAREDHSALLQKVDIPFCFIIGKHDGAIPFEVSMRQTHIANSTYIKVLESTGHVGMLEEEDAFNRELGEFLHSALLR